MLDGPLSWPGTVTAATTPRRVVVVGGGTSAARKAAALARDGIRVAIVAPSICDAVRDVLVDHDEVSWEHRTLCPADLERSWLVLPATGDSASDAVVHRWAERLRRGVGRTAGLLPGVTAARTS